MIESANHPTPYFSVVAASRNDDHGGDPLVRTQIFITNFARQCEKYCLPAELILVDWNPVPDRPGLAGVLQLPAEASWCRARVITVPAELDICPMLWAKKTGRKPPCHWPRYQSGGSVYMPSKAAAHFFSTPNAMA